MPKTSYNHNLVRFAAHILEQNDSSPDVETWNFQGILRDLFLTYQSDQLHMKTRVSAVC